MTRLRIHNCAWLTAATILALCGALAAYVLKPEASLYESCRPAADASAWTRGFGGYFWQSDHSVLAFVRSGTHMRAVTVDLPSGLQTDHAALSSQLVSAESSNYLWRLSPDGSKLVWRDIDNGFPEWRVSNLDGALVHRSDSLGSEYAALWLPDSTGWVDTHEYSTPAGPRQECTVHPLHGKDRNVGMMPAKFNWPLTILRSGGALGGNWNNGRSSGSAPKIDWNEIEIATKARLIRSGSSPLPAETTGLIEVETSPDGSRFACLVQYTHFSPIERVLSRFLPARFTPRNLVGLWIIDRTGRRSQFLGSEQIDQPYGLLWTPDGKHVSFVDRGTLSISKDGEIR